MYDWNVYSPRPDYGSEPRLVEFRDLPGLTGYASVYSISAESAEAIITAGSTAKFAGVVWSERLWIDIDGLDKLEEVEKRLQQRKLGYDVWFTGGRGYHLGVNRDCFPSHLLPHQDKQWAKATFGGDLVDLGIYTHLHLFRLPNTLHERTGKPKEFLRSVPGNMLELPRYDRGNTANIGSFGNGSSPASIFSNFEVMAKVGPVRVGNRHSVLVSTGYSLARHGVTAEAALWWLSEMNKYFEEPKSEEEIIKVVQDVFRG